jgi:hypothetical protein
MRALRDALVPISALLPIAALSAGIDDWSAGSLAAV